MGFEIWNNEIKHRNLQIEILRLIVKGEWKPDEKIPVPKDLYHFFDGRYSYGIIRIAIELLIEDDCLYAINGKGIYVSPNAELVYSKIVEQVLYKIKQDVEILAKLNTFKNEVIRVVDEAYDNNN